jgi:plasmid stabilization system protein ParE
MPTYTYNDFRAVLGKAGFTLLRSRKHETWRKILTDGTILIVRVSHQHNRDIDRNLFRRMLR